MFANPGSTRRTDRRAHGFTLIELLVVLGVIALLVTAFMPAISSAFGRSDEAATEARKLGLVSMIQGFERVYGFYPPDDFTAFKDRIEGIELKGDPINSGIESLVIYLSWEEKGNARLDEHEDWLANTDADQNGVSIPLLGRKDKVEVVDVWGTPFAYFSARTGSGYQGSQKIRTAEEDGIPGVDLVAKPWKNSRSNAYLGPRTFQLISAGPDREFNTDDDIVHPERPQEIE